jgi:hypothetical protein
LESFLFEFTPPPVLRGWAGAAFRGTAVKNEKLKMKDAK